MILFEKEAFLNFVFYFQTVSSGINQLFFKIILRCMLRWNLQIWCSFSQSRGVIFQNFLCRVGPNHGGPSYVTIYSNFLNFHNTFKKPKYAPAMGYFPKNLVREINLFLKLIFSKITWNYEEILFINSNFFPKEKFYSSFEIWEVDLVNTVERSKKVGQKWLGVSVLGGSKNVFFTY